MNILHGFKELVDKILLMNILEDSMHFISSYERIKVRLHIVEHEVDICISNGGRTG